MNYRLFVSCPKNIETLLADELRAFGVIVDKVTPQGVFGDASLTALYQICLWSRLANRVHLLLFHGHVYNEQTLYQQSYQFHWQTVFTIDKTLAIEFHGTHPQLRHTIYNAQVLKDGIVDYFKKFHGDRPRVDTAKPNI